MVFYLFEIKKFVNGISTNLFLEHILLSCNCQQIPFWRCPRTVFASFKWKVIVAVLCVFAFCTLSKSQQLIRITNHLIPFC